MIEGSGAVHRDNGSGSRGPQNIRIRIRNTVIKLRKIYTCKLIRYYEGRCRVDVHLLSFIQVFQTYRNILTYRTLWCPVLCKTEDVMTGLAQPRSYDAAFLYTDQPYICLAICYSADTWYVYLCTYVFWPITVPSISTLHGKPKK